MRVKRGDRVLTWCGEGEVVEKDVYSIKGMTRVLLDEPPPFEYNLGMNPALFWADEFKQPEKEGTDGIQND